MDTETKEAILKLAGYDIQARRSRLQGSHAMVYEVGDYHSLPTPKEIIARSTKRDVAINLAYNAFLTRQNDVVETS